MMEETKSGIGVMGVLFVILVIWAIFGGGFGNGCGNGFGFGNRCNNAPYVPYWPDGGCNRVSNCEIEKSEIIDSVRTQFLIEQNGAATRTAIRDSRDDVTGQASRIYEQWLQETIFDLKMENQGLKGQLYSDAKFGAIEKQLSSCCCDFARRLDGIECEMLKRPQLTGVGITCNGHLVPPAGHGLTAQKGGASAPPLL